MREFRSDTMTLPTEAMRRAMVEAELGDDVCDEDPTVNSLQKTGAKMLGMEAALFVPSGTFGNQCAVGVHTMPGNEVVLSETSHMIDHEAGAMAALWSVQTRTISPSSAQWVTAEEIAARLRTVEDVHQPDTGLIVIENALAEGTAMPLDEMRRVRDLAAQHGIPVHLDGARVFNAALALGVKACELTGLVDSVSVCLSKGLGAPVGSLLCGTREFISRAKRVRKQMGGGMRQAGVIAAPAIVALSEGVARLKEDHDNAQLLAGLLSRIPGVALDMDSVQTNMVFCRVEEEISRSSAGLVKYLFENGFRTYAPGWWGVRFVLSSRVNSDDVRSLASAVGDYMSLPDIS